MLDELQEGNTLKINNLENAAIISEIQNPKPGTSSTVDLRKLNLNWVAPEILKQFTNNNDQN